MPNCQAEHPGAKVGRGGSVQVQPALRAGAIYNSSPKGLGARPHVDGVTLTTIFPALCWGE